MKIFRKLITFGIILSIGAITFIKVKPMIVDYATDKVIATAISKNASQFGIDETVINKVIDSVSEEDKITIKNMVTDYYNNGVVDKAIDIYQTEGVESLKEYIDTTLTNQDKDKLKDMYNKYIQENVNQSENNTTSENDDLNITTETITDVIQDINESDVDNLVQEWNNMSEDEQQDFLNEYNLNFSEDDINNIIQNSQ